MSEELSPSRIAVIREVWRILKQSSTVEKAREDFKEAILRMILGE